MESFRIRPSTSAGARKKERGRGERKRKGQGALQDQTHHDSKEVSLRSSPPDVIHFNLLPTEHSVKETGNACLFLAAPQI